MASTAILNKLLIGVSLKLFFQSLSASSEVCSVRTISLLACTGKKNSKSLLQVHGPAVEDPYRLLALLTMP